MIHGAAGVPDSTVRLHLGGDALNSSTLTGTAECVDVPAVSLQQIVHQRRFARCALVCDIEGAELFLISNELPTLKAHVEVLIVEFHPAISGPSAVEDAHRLLGEHRFQQLWDEQNTFVFRNLALT
jgi:hypothetical protein